MRLNCRITLCRHLLAAVAFLSIGAMTRTNAQENAAPQELNASSRSSGAQSPEARKPAGPSASSVSPNQALYLVRSALLTLNDANHSGNYTVLRDLAAPDFQARNTAAELAQSFADLRRRNFDLFAVAILEPQFTVDPAVDSNGRLHLAGFFATRPLQVGFDLIFQSVSGQWRLLAISVATPEAPRPQAQLERPPQTRTARPFYGVRVLSGIVGWRW